MVQSVRGGKATLVGAQGTQNARAGATIREGDILQTDSTAQTDVLLGDLGPVVRLTPDTSVRFTRAANDPSLLELELTRGRITGNTEGLKEGARYQVRTLKGVVNVPSNEFNIKADSPKP